MAINSAIDFSMKASAQLERNLATLGPTVGRKVGQRAVRKGAKVIVDQAKRNVAKNRKTGNLQKSLTVQAEKKRFLKFDEVGAVMGFKRPTSRRAHLLEFGTRHSRAFPFFRPALDTKANAALRVMRAEVAEGTKIEAGK